MGTPIAGSRQIPYVEDIASGNSVSSFFANKLAQCVAFINNYQIMRLNFGAVGTYPNVGLPILNVGLPEVIEFNSQIVNVWVTSELSGTSGTTEIDLKVQPLGSSTWTSIFSTTPKVTSASANDVVIDSAGKVATPPTGMTRPVITTSFVFNAGDRVRCDLIQGMVGGGGIYLNLHIQPR
jgi:hypothetical protein